MQMIVSVVVRVLVGVIVLLHMKVRRIMHMSVFLQMGMRVVVLVQVVVHVKHVGVAVVPTLLAKQLLITNLVSEFTWISDTLLFWLLG